MGLLSNDALYKLMFSYSLTNSLTYLTWCNQLSSKVSNLRYLSKVAVAVSIKIADSAMPFLRPTNSVISLKRWF